MRLYPSQPVQEDKLSGRQMLFSGQLFSFSPWSCAGLGCLFLLCLLRKVWIYHSFPAGAELCFYSPLSENCKYVVRKAFQFIPFTFNLSQAPNRCGKLQRISSKSRTAHQFQFCVDFEKVEKDQFYTCSDFTGQKVLLIAAFRLWK